MHEAEDKSKIRLRIRSSQGCVKKLKTLLREHQRKYISSLKNPSTIPLNIIHFG